MWCSVSSLGLGCGPLTAAACRAQALGTAIGLVLISCLAGDAFALAPAAGGAPLEASAAQRRSPENGPQHRRVGAAAGAGNPTWGYRRIHGDLRGLGITLAPSAIWAILRSHAIEPAPSAGGAKRSQFLRAQASAIVACDFLTVDTVWLRRLYVRFFIELTNRRVHCGGVTANPNERWVTQQARNLVMTLAEQERPVRFLVRDRDSKFPRKLRRGLPHRGHPRNPHTGAGAVGEGARRAQGGKPAARMSRSAPDRRPPSARAGRTGLHQASQRAPAAPLARPAPTARKTASSDAVAAEPDRSPRPRGVHKCDLAANGADPSMTDFVHPPDQIERPQGANEP
jgi:hypothetical protein